MTWQQFTAEIQAELTAVADESLTKIHFQDGCIRLIGEVIEQCCWHTHSMMGSGYYNNMVEGDPLKCLLGFCDYKYGSRPVGM